ncbi:bile acid:sodium symporter family protein [Runella rosea]|uniref:Bile acid:sodium symporter family protein n=1 Tax=Runella rosea TaxID=2259595 RepID=A0A344TDS0_9BACT|nr:bile acid:sodium symporter family protein [Runella rosea]AXE16791.1 bile acid:sodium symporter family protein [Runella rosea]
MKESLAALDYIRLDFSAESSATINVALALIMFGVALDIKPEHFKNLIQNPRQLIAGVLSQAILLPAATFGLVMALGDNITVGVALGMILVAACPGGNISNFITSFAKGNVALAVSLTAISTILAVVMTPFNFTFWGNMYAQANSLVRPIELDWRELLKSVMMILGLPMALGMLCSVYLPRLAERLIKPLRQASLVFFIVLVVVAFTKNFDIFINHITYVFLLVLIHNGIALGMGYLTATVFGLSETNRRTLSIETGIHNSGLGLALLFNPAVFPPDLPLGGMAIVAGWWSIWHIVSGTTLAFYWQRKSTLVGVKD